MGQQRGQGGGIWGDSRDRVVALRETEGQGGGNWDDSKDRTVTLMG